MRAALVVSIEVDGAERKSLGWLVELVEDSLAELVLVAEQEGFAPVRITAAEVTGLDLEGIPNKVPARRDGSERRQWEAPWRENERRAAERVSAREAVSEGARQARAARRAPRPARLGEYEAAKASQAARKGHRRPTPGQVGLDLPPEGERPDDALRGG